MFNFMCVYNTHTHGSALGVQSANDLGSIPGGGGKKWTVSFTLMFT